MNKPEFFELITDYIAKNHSSIYMEAMDNIYSSNFLTYKYHADKELKEEARNFLRLFGLKHKV